MAQCPTISCPSNITVNNDPSICGAVVTYPAPTASNPCAIDTDTLNYTGSIVNWTVPAGVTSVHIEARGAQGGWNTNSVYQPGMGAVMSGDFTVTPGQQLKVLVGQQPSNGSGNGGGGGTFVTDMSNTPLIVAGGGGGSSQGTDSPDKHGQAGTSGGTGAAGGGTGGTNGSGGSIGASGFQSGAGGGLLTNGTDGWTGGTGGFAFVNGGAGAATNAPANGGFGGGGSGSSYVVGGGGGGYSGGGSGGNSSAGVGGGGGSYNAGTNQVNTGGANTGDGMVLISYTNGSIITLTQTAGPASGSTFPTGTTTVTYVADDGLGNDDTCSFTVTVNDNEAPVADVASLPNATGQCSVTIAAPTASDNCAGTLTATTTDPLTYSAQGTYSITWTYDDGNGNTSTQTQTVVVSDNTAPMADVASLSAITGTCTATAAAPTATDNCAGTINGTTTDPTTYTVAGTYNITWMYDDGNGNTSTQTQQVTITGVDTSVSVGNATYFANLAGASYEWLDCTTGTVIPGETGQSFTPGANGTYAVIVTQNGCTDTSSCYPILSVGIESTGSALLVSAYPNPTTGIVNLGLAKGTTADLLVYNAYGQLVLSEKATGSKAVDLSNCDAGIYYISVRTSSGMKVIRVARN
jgi:hypothetical protein